METRTITERPDDAILDEVRLTFVGPMIDEIGVTSLSGIVTLRGPVDSWSQRRSIGMVVHEIDGVRRVLNLLTVRAPALAATGVRTAIEDALARRAMREARRLDFEIYDGRVTVTGRVGSSGERDTVVGAVVGMAGVRSVDDQLRIGPAERAGR
jgi:osmotically-inducible protein OsmY